MSKKTFGLSKEGERIYRVSLNASKIVENVDGSIIKDMIIDKIESLGDFYSFMFTLSDGSRIRVNRNNEVAVIERMTDEWSKHPMALFEDYYSQDRRTLLKTVSDRLGDNAERMNNLRTEALKISNSCIISKDIVDGLYQMFETCTDSEERFISEVEFAEMAL